MPCIDDRDCSVCRKKNCICLQNKVDMLTDLLCKACRYNMINGSGLPEEAHIWWEEHQKLDAKRLAREKADKVAAMRHKMTQMKELEKEIEGMKADMEPEVIK
jgi:hypothetical protein